METLPLTIQPPRRSMRARLARCAVMLVIFMAGGVAGYCVGTVPWTQFDTDQVKVMTQPDKFTEFLLAQMKKDLVLTDEQYPEVQKILVRHHEGFDKIRRQTQPLFDKQMATLEREMQAVLTPAQWTRYKAQLDWLRNRHRRSSNGGPPRSSGKDGHRGPGPQSGPGRSGQPAERPLLEQPKVLSPTAPQTELPAKTKDCK